MIINLKVDIIYHLKKESDLESLNLCIIKSNRNNASKNKKMQVGCEKTGMQAPGILAEAHLAKSAGYTLLDAIDNHEVTDAEVGGYFVIVDGNTRFHAWLLSQRSGKNRFDYLYQFKEYSDAASFKMAYNTINVYNTPTSSSDFARDILATTSNPVLFSYREKIDRGLAPKAAGYATIGREITKKDMEDLQDGKIPALFNDQPRKDRFEYIYSGLNNTIKANLKMFKGAEIWSWIASMINGADDKDMTAKKIVKMFNPLSYIDGRAIESAKRQGNESKEVVVKNILDRIFNDLQ